MGLAGYDKKLLFHHDSELRHKKVTFQVSVEVTQGALPTKRGYTAAEVNLEESTKRDVDASESQAGKLRLAT
jgi:hypothetical protein